MRVMGVLNRMISVARKILVLGLAGCSSWPALACSPPPPLPDPVLKAQADVIVIGTGVFSEADGGGRIVPQALVKGPRRQSYRVDISHRWSGPPSGLCPPVNALLGRQTGLFYLSRGMGGRFRIVGFRSR